MATDHLTTVTAIKSPTHQGLRGSTPPQPHHHPHATWAEIPHYCADFAVPHPAPRGEEEEELKRQNKPTFTHVTP
jgi:hypothetical protein